MIVYAESNFVLELVLRQREGDDAEEILRLAEAGDLHFVIPAFALVEPVWTLNAHHSRRIELIKGLESEQKQLERSKHRREFAGHVGHAIRTFRQLRADDVSAYRDTLRRIRRSSEVLPIGVQIIETSVRIAEDLGLEVFDALILSSILAHCARERSGESRILLSKDRDFDKPEVLQTLQEAQCEYSNNFRNVLSRLGRTRPDDLR